jgi:hypothetical protein
VGRERRQRRDQHHHQGGVADAGALVTGLGGNVDRVQAGLRYGGVDLGERPLPRLLQVPEPRRLRRPGRGSRPTISGT